MTAHEMRVVANIASTADSACCVCAGELFVRLERAFPEHREVLLAVWSADQSGDYRKYESRVGK